MIRAGDWVLVILAALLVGTVFATTWDEAGPAAYLVIRAPDQEPRRVPLTHEHRLEIDGRVGTSVIQVESGRVRFISSPCFGQYCVHQGWLDQAGQLAVCLPNGVSVTLVGEDSRFDAIGY